MLSRYEQHRRAATALLALLYATRRTERQVLAVLLTETFFRDSVQRFLEYGTWLVLSAIWPSRAARLSVGIAQIQLRHWVRLGSLRSTRFSVRALAAVMSLEANYDICAALLRERGLLEATPRQVAAAYRGEARGYHVRTLNWFYCSVRPIAPVGRCSRAWYRITTLSSGNGTSSWPRIPRTNVRTV